MKKQKQNVSLIFEFIFRRMKTRETFSFFFFNENKNNEMVPLQRMKKQQQKITLKVQLCVVIIYFVCKLR